jgi:hypothetical protein
MSGKPFISQRFSCPRFTGNPVEVRTEQIKLHIAGARFGLARLHALLVAEKQQAIRHHLLTAAAAVAVGLTRHLPSLSASRIKALPTRCANSTRGAFSGNNMRRRERCSLRVSTLFSPVDAREYEPFESVFGLQSQQIFTS